MSAIIMIIKNFYFSIASKKGTMLDFDVTDKIEVKESDMSAEMTRASVEIVRDGLRRFNQDKVSLLENLAKNFKLNLFEMFQIYDLFSINYLKLSTKIIWQLK